MMERTHPLVLVTGFGPYPRVRINPTGQLAMRVGASKRFGRLGLAVAAHVFETSYAAAGRDIGPLLERLQPVACLHLGLAPRSPMIRIETRGENRTRRLAVDVKGRLPGRRSLVPDGPAMLRGSPVARPALAATRRAGLPARLSHDAGAYLCNAVYFWSLDAARRGGHRRPILFVHLPWPAAAAGTRPLGRPRPKRQRPPVAALLPVLETIAIRLATAARAV